MNTQLTISGTIAGVPLTLQGEIGPHGAVYSGAVDGLSLDTNRFLSGLLWQFGASPPDVTIPPVRLEKLRVAYNTESGWFSLAARIEGFELFVIRQMKAGNALAYGLRTTQPIYLGSLPFIDQYAAEFPELTHLGIQDLGLFYASSPGEYIFPPDAASGQGSALFVAKAGGYAWITQNIAPTGEAFWMPPVKPPDVDAAAKGGETPGGDEGKRGKAQDKGADMPQQGNGGEASETGKGEAGSAQTKQEAAEPPKDKLSWLNVNKTAGPFTLAKVGGRFADNKVTVVFSASVAAAGLTINVDGLGLIITSLYPIALTPTLSGISIFFARGPVELGGGLATPDRGHTFFGEIRVKVKSFGLTAFGGYYSEDPKSLFVFGMLEAALGGPPAFFVTGLAAGFGYHSKLTLPPVSELQDFLLVKGALPAAAGNPFAKKQGGDLLQTLMDSPSIRPDPNEYWLAAGVRFTSFQMVQSFALLTVSFGTRVEIALLGRSQISIPPRLSSGDENWYAVAFAEVDLKAVIDPGASGEKPVLAVDGIVAAGSYVFAKGCRLTGGFAFYIWDTGEFVLTLGGYHPRYQAPAYYPAVSRVGFAWPVSGNLYMQGQLYFALTGSGIMAGFDLQAVFQSGPVVASFRAQADFLIEWRPFHYEATVQIAISVSVQIRLPFVTSTLSYHVSVRLEVFGPPFGGLATVNLDVISFSIPFGAEKAAPADPLTWPQFAESFLPDDSTAPAGAPLVVWASVTGGLVRESKGSGWIINPRELEITTHTVVPATEVTKGRIKHDSLFRDEFNKLGIRPMRATKISSIHTVTIEKRNEDEVFKECTDELEFEAVKGSSPVALYGQDAPQSDKERLEQPTMLKDTLAGIRIRAQIKKGECAQVSLLQTDAKRSCRGFAEARADVPRNDLARHPASASRPGDALLDALREAGFGGLPAPATLQAVVSQAATPGTRA